MIYIPEKNLYIGDRVATWMFYLSEVEEGGRTVFPRVGAGVRPEAGSAVFWYNLLETGQADRLTLHGACPVLFGTKWGELYRVDISVLIIIPSGKQVAQRGRPALQEKMSQIRAVIICDIMKIDWLNSEL